MKIVIALVCLFALSESVPASYGKIFVICNLFVFSKHKFDLARVIILIKMLDCLLLK